MSKRTIKTLRLALHYAILERESFLDCITDRHFGQQPPTPMKGYVKEYRDNERLIKQFRKAAEGLANEKTGIDRRK